MLRLGQPGAGIVARRCFPLRSRALAISAAAGLVVIGGAVGLLLARSPGGSSANAAASYSFPAQQYPDGLVIVRYWRLSGPGDLLLTETIKACSAKGKALAVPFDESIAAGAITQTLRFTPRPSKVLDGGRVVQWDLRVPAHGSVVVGYQAKVTPQGTAEASLNRWAADFDELAVGPVIPTGTAPAVELRSVRISPSTVRIGVGHSVQLRLSGVLPDGKAAPAALLAAVTWRSANPSVATVSSSGKVTGRKAGSTRVTAQAGDPVSISVPVTVTGAAPSPGSSTAPGPQPTTAPPPPVTTGPQPPPTSAGPPPTTQQPTPTLTPTTLGPEVAPAPQAEAFGPAERAATLHRSLRLHASRPPAMHVLRLALLIAALLGIF